MPCDDTEEADSLSFLFVRFTGFSSPAGKLCPIGTLPVVESGFTSADGAGTSLMAGTKSVELVTSSS